MNDRINRMFLLSGIIIFLIISCLYFFNKRKSENIIYPVKEFKSSDYITPELRKIIIEAKFNELREEWKQIQKAGLDKYPYYKKKR